MKFVIVSGNAIDGLVLYGPFDNFDEAETIAARELDDDDWVITDLLPLDMITENEEVIEG